jgi:hypothetical protein
MEVLEQELVVCPISEQHRQRRLETFRSAISCNYPDNKHPSRPGAIHAHSKAHYKTFRLQLTPLQLLDTHRVYLIPRI